MYNNNRLYFLIGLVIFIKKKTRIVQLVRTLISCIKYGNSNFSSGKLLIL